jgi:hypothetical protein
MEFDLIGKINHIRLCKTQPLVPLLEALVNSIHATKYSGIEDGKIGISIERDTRQKLLSEEMPDSRPIKSFTIIDNGVGFNDENFKAFNTANTINRIELGGRGVGRFIWLKAFAYVTISSVYQDNGELKKRSFEFRLSKKGIENHQDTAAPEERRETTVKLIDFSSFYSSTCPTGIETIVETILRHCMGYLRLEECPVIKISDPANNKSIVINDIYNNHIDFYANHKFKLKKQSFEIDLYKVYNITTSHELHYTVDDREVQTKPLSKDIPELNKKIKSEERDDFYIKAYLKGNYLNSLVNDERTSLSFPQIEGGLDYPDIITETELRDKAVENIEKAIKDYLEKIRSGKLDKIREYIEKKGPQYRPLLKYKRDALEKLPILSDAKLEIELFRILTNLETDLKKEGRSFLKKIKTVQDFQTYRDKYNEYIDKVIHVGNTSLSKYIIHRRAVIEMLEKHLEADELGEFVKENAVHSLIFPLKSTSDDISYEDHNLWLIDERLAYHTYLASDIAFKSIEPAEVNSEKRPDIVLFNDYFDNRFVFSERKKTPFPSIVIVEFKRPMRRQYNKNEDDPVNQIIDYIVKIKNDKKRLKNDRQFNLRENIPIYGYIVCDLTSGLKSILANNRDFQPTPDGMGMYRYFNNLSTYIEIISYDKLLEDSKKRNQILFDKLRLPI